MGLRLHKRTSKAIWHDELSHVPFLTRLKFAATGLDALEGRLVPGGRRGKAVHQFGSLVHERRHLFADRVEDVGILGEKKKAFGVAIDKELGRDSAMQHHRR